MGKDRLILIRAYHHKFAHPTSTHLAQVFGLEVKAQSEPKLDVDPVWIESLLQQRQQARAEKRYAESDYLR